MLTNVRGKIKWQFLVTCKNCHLPFFPCRHTLFHSMTYIWYCLFSAAARSDYFPSTFWMRIANPPERARCIFNVVLELTFLVVMEYV